jgi:zinc finger CCCH domain-containing protein 13
LRRDRDRDEKRPKDAEHRRDRDSDPDEDSRRWRDDGKREERMAARRERNRQAQDTGQDSSDRRWTVIEERDGRSKRNATRSDRKGTEEGRTKDERRAEKEKEPAWMDTYVPSASTTGIFGGKDANGELDGIQAWKKGMKDKERKDKDLIGTSSTVSTKDSPNEGDVKLDSQLDEIQLFKLMMKRDQDKRQNPIDDLALGDKVVLAGELFTRRSVTSPH